MTVSEVRNKYLEFFKARGHTIIPSAPIVPENDPTTLFTSSGMQPLVPYLLGQEHPGGPRLANSQLSFRAGDIEEVGDNRHTTFFEMLGNWSFGDYFKKEQLPWVYQFLTEELKLPKDRLWVTCFAGDEALGLPKDTESAEIWKGIGMPEDRILFYDAKKNWWSRSGTPDKMPVGEPGGPDSEIFFDFQTPHDPAFGKECHPNCDCGRFMEIGNSVFMEYIKNADGTFGKLPKRNVDFGGGLERLAAATNDNPDVFLIDVFDAARAVLEKRSSKKYQGEASLESEGRLASLRAFRVILDHTRAASFMLASGIRPSNTEQGYVLRRLIRRSIREADKLGIKEAVLAEVAEGFSSAYREAYPFVLEAAQVIREEFGKEEAQFRKTLEKGLKILDHTFKFYSGERLTNSERRQKLDSAPDEVFAESVFQLITTYGFPRELVKEILTEKQIITDWEEVDKLINKSLAEHQAKSRAGAAQKFAGGLADHAEQTVRYHTAHHLLLAALRKVLGPDVHQRGSNITSERLRIDFSYGQKMTPEQKAEVERIVNEKIAEGLPVVRTVMKKEEAEKLGAEHEFGASYPEQVSVYSVGPIENAFSIEFCGGPHVSNTSELARVRDLDGSDRKGPPRRAIFKIQKEEASSAGVRRIKAVLE